jgi:hypothetical protein
MNKLQTNGHDSDIASTIHLEFIQNVAASNDENGLETVAEYHRAIFLNHYGQELERNEQKSKIHEDRLNYLSSRLGETHSKLSGLEKLIPVEENGQPDVEPTSLWNNWDRVMFGLAACSILSMLVFGVFNISFNLLESGIVTFLEHPVRAYFWAALLPVGALAVKAGWDFVRSQRIKEIYLWICLVIGISGVLVWLMAYASVYPSLSKTTAEHIESLSVFDQGGPHGESGTGLTMGGAKSIDMVIVASQALAEIFLSAVLGIYMTTIYNKHRPVRLAINPSFGQLDQERLSLEQNVSDERLALADSRGTEKKLNNQLTVFVSFARTLFDKEVRLRRDKGHQKTLLLNRIEEQLRSQLESVDDDSPLDWEASQSPSTIKGPLAL